MQKQQHDEMVSSLEEQVEDLQKKVDKLERLKDKAVQVLRGRGFNPQKIFHIIKERINL